MGQLQVMQAERNEWIAHNFPQEDEMLGNVRDVVYGMVEEMGELCHALLKASQGIRGMGDPAVLREQVIDAHCDLIIFSLGLPKHFEYDLETELQRTWDKVKARDWIADPVGAGNE